MATCTRPTFSCIYLVLTQSAGTNVAPIRDIIPIRNNPVFALTAHATRYRRSNKFGFYSLWFNLTGARTHDHTSLDGRYANHYTTGGVDTLWVCGDGCYKAVSID